MILPRISVAMSVYNNATYLPHAIESILAQTFSDFEFLIVDDGSTDESGAIIDRFAHLDSRIKPIHQANAGLIVSLNYMISLAQAPLIARMPCPNALLGRSGFSTPIPASACWVQAARASTNSANRAATGSTTSHLPKTSSTIFRTDHRFVIRR